MFRCPLLPPYCTIVTARAGLANGLFGHGPRGPPIEGARLADSFFVVVCFLIYIFLNLFNLFIYLTFQQNDVIYWLTNIVTARQFLYYVSLTALQHYLNKMNVSISVTIRYIYIYFVLMAMDVGRRSAPPPPLTMTDGRNR